MASDFGEVLGVPPPCDDCGCVNQETLRCSVQENKNLCHRCFQNLPHARREDVGDQEWVCDNHFDQQVRIFCRTCHVGLCQDCAGVDHRGHDVVCVRELAQEIRCDLVEQLHNVTKNQEGLLQLAGKLEDCTEKKSAAFEEAHSVLDKVVDDIKEKIVKKLDTAVDQIDQETEEKIWKLIEKRDAKRKELANTALEDITRIDGLNQKFTSILREEEVPREWYAQQAKQMLVDDVEACRGARAVVESLLKSEPKKLVENGGPFRSSINHLMTTNSQENIEHYCSEMLLDLPKLSKTDPKCFFDQKQSTSPFDRRYMPLIIVVFTFLFADIKLDKLDKSYNSVISSMPLTPVCEMAHIAFRYLCLQMIYILCLYIIFVDNQSYPLKLYCSFRSKLSLVTSLTKFALAHVLMIIAFHFLVILLCLICQINSIDGVLGYSIKLIQLCLFLCHTQMSKRNKKLISDVIFRI